MIDTAGPELDGSWQTALDAPVVVEVRTQNDILPGQPPVVSLAIQQAAIKTCSY